MSAEVVRIHGRIFVKLEPPFEAVSHHEAHCDVQTCGTCDGIVPAEWDFPDPTPDETVYEIQQRKFTKEWWKSPAGEQEKRYRRERKIERQRRKAAWEADQLEKLNERKREWARDAMRCGLPNPYPHLFPTRESV